MKDEGCLNASGDHNNDRLRDNEHDARGSNCNGGDRGPGPEQPGPERIREHGTQESDEIRANVNDSDRERIVAKYIPALATKCPVCNNLILVVDGKIVEQAYQAPITFDGICNSCRSKLYFQPNVREVLPQKPVIVGLNGKPIDSSKSILTKP